MGLPSDRIHHAVGEGRTWGFEAAYLGIHLGDAELVTEWDLVVLSAGPMFQPYGGTPLVGFFVQPKFSIILVRNRIAYMGLEFPRFDHRTAGIGAEIGADIGFQIRWGPLYVAPVFGISAGVGHNVADGLFMLWPNEPGLRSGFGMDLNLNLLRFGFVF